MSKFDDTYRSDKSNERNVWEEEHFWDDGGASASSLSAGYHREGSFRPYVGPESQVSTIGPGQRLMFTSNTSELYTISSSATPKLLSRFAPVIWHPLLGSLDTTVGAVTLGSAKVGLVVATQAGVVHPNHLMIPVASYNTTRVFTSGGVATTIHWMQESSAARQSTGRVIDVQNPTVGDIGIPSVGSNYRLSLYTTSASSLT